MDQKGEKVWLYNPQSKKGRSPKLQTPWEGLWEVTNQVTDVVYRIQRTPRGRPSLYAMTAWNHFTKGICRANEFGSWTWECYLSRVTISVWSWHLERFIVTFKFHLSLSKTFSTVQNYCSVIFRKDVFFFKLMLSPLSFFLLCRIPLLALEWPLMRGRISFIGREEM